MKYPLFKATAALLVTTCAAMFAAPSLVTVPSFFPQTKINLGLDLQGGAHLLLGVKFSQYVDDQLRLLSDAIKSHLRDEKIGYKDMEVHDNVLGFTLRDPSQDAKAQEKLASMDSGIEVKAHDGRIAINFTESQLQALHTKVIEQSIEIIRMRVDSNGTTEPTIQRQGDDFILLEVPGQKDPEGLKAILGQTAKLTFHIVDEEGWRMASLPKHLMLAQGQEGQAIVESSPSMTGDVLVDATAAFQEGKPVIQFRLNALGTKLFGQLTKQNVNRQLAILLDDRLLSAPNISTPITGGNGVISGNFTIESAQELAMLLRAGALPAPLEILEERIIGPNLGADSIESGKRAGVTGFIGVVIFMIWSYGALGVFASISLLLAVVYIFAMLGLLQATLTLPGIAGIILTIGMAVDANVLVYERIREEINAGISNLYAIEKGFTMAFATIFDANITTLVVAFILYAFGAGAVKGFAVTLSVGIVASMFACVFVTKVMIDAWMKVAKPVRPLIN